MIFLCFIAHTKYNYSLKAMLLLIVVSLILPRKTRYFSENNSDVIPDLANTYNKWNTHNADYGITSFKWFVKFCKTLHKFKELSCTLASVTTLITLVAMHWKFYFEKSYTIMIFQQISVLLTLNIFLIVSLSVLEDSV